MRAPCHLLKVWGPGPFYTWTMHMPGTEAPTVLWTRATRLPQIAKTDQLVIPSFRMQRPRSYNSKSFKDSGSKCVLNPKPFCIVHQHSTL